MRGLDLKSPRFLALAVVALGVTVPLLAADQRARVLASNTLLLSVSVALASMTVGVPLAFALTRTDIAGRRWSGAMLLAMLFVPLYLQAAAWEAGFGLQGWYTAQAGGSVLLEGWRGAIAIHTAAAIPWIVLIVGLGLLLAEPELEEAALLDGTPWQVFRRVTLPRAAPSLGAAFLWVAVTTAGEMTVTDLFQIRTYAEQVYTEFALGDVIGAAPWRLLPSTIAAAWIVVGGLVLVSRLVPADRHASERLSLIFSLGRWRWPASVAALGTVAFLVGVPIASLIIKAGMLVTRDDRGLVRHWSTAQCARLVAGSPVRFSREFLWSIAVAALAATLVLVIGLLLAWPARGGGWRATIAWLAIAICLAVPGPLVGLGCIELFTGQQWPWLLDLYDHSLAPIVLAQSVRALPLCTLVLWYALRTISPDVLDSAALEGATGLRRFLRIALPQRRAALAAAWLVAFAVAWGELAASILVVPPGVITLPIQIFNLIHYGVDDQVAGISLVVLAAFFLLAAVVGALTRKPAE
jgi:iron(III) transport system permease protein